MSNDDRESILDLELLDAPEEPSAAEYRDDSESILESERPADEPEYEDPPESDEFESIRRPEVEGLPIKCGEIHKPEPLPELEDPSDRDELESFEPDPLPLS